MELVVAPRERDDARILDRLEQRRADRAAGQRVERLRIGDRNGSAKRLSGLHVACPVHRRADGEVDRTLLQPDEFLQRVAAGRRRAGKDLHGDAPAGALPDQLRPIRRRPCPTRTRGRRRRSACSSEASVVVRRKPAASAPAPAHARCAPVDGSPSGQGPHAAVPDVQRRGKRRDSNTCTCAAKKPRAGRPVLWGLSGSLPSFTGPPPGDCSQPVAWTAGRYLYRSPRLQNPAKSSEVQPHRQSESARVDAVTASASSRALRIGLARIARLDHHAQHRLGTGRPQQHATVSAERRLDRLLGLDDRRPLLPVDLCASSSR